MKNCSSKWTILRVCCIYKNQIIIQLICFFCQPWYYIFLWLQTTSDISSIDYDSNLVNVTGFFPSVFFFKIIAPYSKLSFIALGLKRLFRTGPQNWMFQIQQFKIFYANQKKNYIYIYIYIYVLFSLTSVCLAVYIYIYLYIYICVCVCVCVCTCACIYLSFYIHFYMHKYLYIYIYIYMHIWLSICSSIYMYIYMYICLCI